MTYPVRPIYDCPFVAHAQKRHFMKAKKFEQQFDEGVDLTASLDLSKAKRVRGPSQL